MAFAIISIQCQSGEWLVTFGIRFRIPWPTLAVDEQQVLVAIVIEVEERAPATHGLGQQLLATSSVLVLEVDACRLGDIREVNGRQFDLQSFSNLNRCQLCLLNRRRRRGTREQVSRDSTDATDDRKSQQRPT